jgi:hypothetical protein
MNAELSDLGWNAYGGTRRQAVGITTIDGVYLEILNHMLQTQTANGSSNVFVWVITNVLPDGFYHWGQDGQQGSYKIMDEFRAAVRKYVSGHQEYHRLFLLSDRLSRDTEDDGIYLRRANDVAALNKKVLLLVSEEKDDRPVESARDLSFWQHLGVAEEIVSRQEVNGNSKRTYYAIIDESVSKRKIGPTGKKREISRRFEDKSGSYFVKPVKLLDHFAKNYQWKEGAAANDRPMFFKQIPNKEALRPLPAPYPDCMILGTKVDNDYQPVVAISTNLVLNSKTMKMRVFTSKDDLDNCKKFWIESHPKRLDEFLKDLPEETELTRPATGSDDASGTK